MLQFQRGKNKNEFNLSLRRKESEKNGFFWKAFGIALSIHLSAIALFYITPFKTDSFFLFPHVRVQTDLPSFSQQAIFFSEKENREIALALPAPAPQLFISNHDTFDFISPTLSNPFKNSENRLISFATSPSILQPLSSPIHLTFSKDLFQLDLKKNLNLPPLTLEPLDYPPEEIVPFEVHVDKKTGLIFWHKIKPSFASKKSIQFIEKLLENIQFQPLTDFGILKGEITFLIPSAEALG